MDINSKRMKIALLSSFMYDIKHWEKRLEKLRSYHIKGKINHPDNSYTDEFKEMIKDKLCAILFNMEGSLRNIVTTQLDGTDMTSFVNELKRCHDKLAPIIQECNDDRLDIELEDVVNDLLSMLYPLKQAAKRGFKYIK